MKKIERAELLLSTPTETMVAFSDNGTFPAAGVMSIENRFPKHNQVYQTEMALQVWVIEGMAEVHYWNNGKNMFETEILKAGEAVNIPRNEYFSITGPAVVSLISANKKCFSLKKGYID